MHSIVIKRRLYLSQGSQKPLFPHIAQLPLLKDGFERVRTMLSEGRPVPVSNPMQRFYPKIPFSEGRFYSHLIDIVLILCFLLLEGLL